MNTDRFKYRIYNEHDKCYVKTPEEDCIPEMLVSPNGDIWGTDRYDLFDTYTYGYIIEHCNGLRDKNRNLIYEGDVVKTVTGCVGVVEWIPERCGFAVHFPDDTYCVVHETQEIIGNIHEGVKK